MARRLDHDEVVRPTLPLRLPYRDDVTVSVVRVISIWTSAPYQRALTRDAGLPDEPNAVTGLYQLAARGSMRPSMLAAELGISPAATSRLVATLSAHGLALRTPDPADARATLVSLTDAGRAAARTLFVAGDTLMRSLLSDWTPRDREELARLMHRFADAVEDDARGADPEIHPREQGEEQ